MVESRISNHKFLGEEVAYDMMDEMDKPAEDDEMMDDDKAAEPAAPADDDDEVDGPAKSDAM